jgi:hypothetical protein
MVRLLCANLSHVHTSDIKLLIIFLIFGCDSIYAIDFKSFVLNISGY